uniref:Reverse transcriptase Ty1/copia-type domain-containing protein n=1 Tax=Vitis vinifera TaxID=29760 RepID=A5B9P1_VITVI|nr:hypothetical protein VITISV_030610 [Vitis vinifera]
MCTDCMVGKQHRDAISKRSLWRASQKLQLVHTDIYEPIKLVSNSKKRQLTATYTPQQNGVAERKNMTIMNMVRSMLSEKQVPKNLWTDAVNWTVHVLNRSPILGMKDMTLEEAWSGVKPNVDYFRVFGCIGHGRSNEETRLDILEWGDSNEEGSEHDQSEEEYAKEVVAGEEGGEVNLSSSYVSGGEFLEEEVEHNNLIMFTSTANPTTFQEAVQNSKWRAAIDLEIEAIERNGTWELTDLPKGMKKIGVKWVFKTKLNENGEVDKCKARLVVKGWSAYQLDVKSAFLHGKLNEAVFVEQPHGYEKKNEEYKVYKLKKALYGLKQAPRAWYNRIETYFVKERFERCNCEHTLFTKTGDGGKILIVSLYVDDLFFTCNDESMFVKFKNSMKLEFDMIDLGKMKYFLGVEVLQNPEGIYISQRKYAKEVLDRFRMEKSNSVKNPIVPGIKLMKDEEVAKVNATMYKQLVGSLMYLIATRLDLTYVVSLISRFMASPIELHLQAAKRVLRYLKCIVDLGVFY